MDVYDKESKLIILGDILYHGPRNDLPLEYNPKGCIEVLNSIKDKILWIKGNCDAEVDEMVLDFKCNENYSLCLNGYNFYLHHGHKDINELPYFKGESPSSEMISMFIYNQLKERIPLVSKVSVWETPTSCASYYEE